MDSRFRGNDDIRLADDIHGVATLKWYNPVDHRNLLIAAFLTVERNYPLYVWESGYTNRNVIGDW